MRKILFIAFLLLARSSYAQLACIENAPVIIPCIATFNWDANPSTDNVTGYNIYLDSVKATPVTPVSTACPGGQCTGQITISSYGLHNVAVSAVSLNGESDYVTCGSCKTTVTLVAIVTPPSPVKNTRKSTPSTTIRVPPAASFTDSSGGVWTLVNNIVLRNGSQVANGTGNLIETCSSKIYARGLTGIFYLSVLSNNVYSWQQLTATDPCP